MTANPTTPSPAPTPKDNGPARLSRPDPGPRGHIGWIVAGSLAAGLVAALLLAAAPFIPAEESHLTGAVLCGFAVGWAMLAVLSVRFTDQPQRWAAAPALFMGLCGLLLVGFGPSVQEVLNWVWPPAMLALAIWMIIRVRRQLRSPSRRWLLYPLFAVLALAVDRRRLRDRAGSRGRQRLPDARPADRRRRTPPAPELHRLRQPHRRARTGRAARCRRTSGGSRRPWPATPESASTTGPVAAGASPRTPRRTAPRSPPTCTPCCSARHVPGPYVLAGHSFGGLYVLAFAARYPDDVAGMVLVDSTAPASAAKHGAASPDDGGSYDVLGRVSALASVSARLGLGRLYQPLFLRQPAAAVPGRGPRRHRDRKQSSQHDRRVRPGERLSAASRIPPGLRRQAAGRPDRRRRQ